MGRGGEGSRGRLSRRGKAQGVRISKDSTTRKFDFDPPFNAARILLIYNTICVSYVECQPDILLLIFSPGLSFFAHFFVRDALSLCTLERFPC